MNKNLKKIISIALTIGTISAVGSITKVNFLTTAAYASSDSNDIKKLYSLKVEALNGSGINLYYDDSCEKYNKIDSNDVDYGHTYYAKTSWKTIKLEPDGPDSKYIRVFNGTSDSTKGEDINSHISLLSGTNTITVKIYKEEPDKYVEYEDNADVQSTYIINIKYVPDGNDDSSDDVINLKSLIVDENDIALSKSQAVYTYNVAENIDAVSIKAKPEENDYKVTINDDDVDENDGFKKSIVLNHGENHIKIEIEDGDNNYREYTLNIIKGVTSQSENSTNNIGSAVIAASTTNTTATVPATSTTIKSGWVQANGGWQYYDSKGVLFTNKWFFDAKYGKWYYLGADGMMAHDIVVDNKWRVDHSGGWDGITL